MSTFKGYNKKATSQHMMRIVKRERILSIIIAGRSSGWAILDRVNPTPKGMKRNDMTWEDGNLTYLRIIHKVEHRNVFEWKVKLIQDTGWLANSNEKIYERDGYLYAEWQDTNKLRIYYDWLRKGKEYTILKVLKYMYSPLFITMFYADNELYLTHEHGWVLASGFHTESDDSIQLQLWMKEVLNYDSKVINDSELAIQSANVESDIMQLYDAIHK